MKCPDVGGRFTNIEQFIPGKSRSFDMVDYSIVPAIEMWVLPEGTKQRLEAVGKKVVIRIQERDPRESSCLDPSVASSSGSGIGPLSDQFDPVIFRRKRQRKLQRAVCTGIVHYNNLARLRLLQCGMNGLGEKGFVIIRWDDN